MTKVSMRVATWWPLANENGVVVKTRLEMGKEYDVEHDVADRWVKRGLATAAKGAKK